VKQQVTGQGFEAAACVEDQVLCADDAVGQQSMQSFHGLSRLLASGQLGRDEAVDTFQVCVLNHALNTQHSRVKFQCGGLAKMGGFDFGL